MNNKIWVGIGEYNIQNSSLTLYKDHNNISWNWPEPTKPYLTVCECCGAPLKETQCEYCGSTYIWK